MVLNNLFQINLIQFIHYKYHIFLMYLKLHIFHQNFIKLIHIFEQLILNHQLLFINYLKLNLMHLNYHIKLMDYNHIRFLLQKYQLYNQEKNIIQNQIQFKNTYLHVILLIYYQMNNLHHLKQLQLYHTLQFFQFQYHL